MRPFIISSLVAVLIAIVVSLFIPPSFGIFLSLMGSWLICGFTVVVAIVAIHRKNKPRQKTCLAIITGTLLAAAIICTAAPFRLAFRLYEPTFDAYAARLANGETLQYPFRIGPFKIIDGGLRNDPYLVSSDNTGNPHVFVNNPDGAGWNIWWLTHLSSKWSFMEED